MTAIADGMTQRTTALPHFRCNPTWKGKDDFGVHVEGIMVQNRPPRLEFSFKNVSGDANAAIDSVHESIMLEQSLRTEEGRPFPKVLYLQLDNVNTNKSKALFAYLSNLVHMRVFEKVKVNFLMVGHTHENIDQLFSRFSVRLRKFNALTLDQLMAVASASFTPAPVCKKVTSARDWTKHFDSVSQDCQDLSFNLAFRLKNIDGKVVLHSKQYSFKPIWESEEVELITAANAQTLVGKHPSPAPLVALEDKDWLALNNLATNLEQHLATAFTGVVKEFWTTQVAFQERVRRSLESATCTDLTPQPCTYIEPNVPADPALEAEARQALLDTLPENLLRRVDPVRRPIYAGARKQRRRNAQRVIEHNPFEITTLAELTLGSMVICLAPSLDNLAFSGRLPGGGQSVPLYLLQVERTSSFENNVTWVYYKPKAFTKNDGRYIAKVKAGTNGTFHKMSKMTQTTSFDPDELLLGWDLEEGEGAGRIPCEQYDQLVTILAAINMEQTSNAIVQSGNQESQQ